MADAEHSKLPWKTRRHPEARYWVVYGNDGSVIATGLFKWRAEQIVTAANAFPDTQKTLEMIANSIFQDNDGEWELSRPAEFLKTIAEEALAKGEHQCHDTKQ